MIVTSVQIKTVKMQKHLYCPVFTKNPVHFCERDLSVSKKSTRSWTGMPLARKSKIFGLHSIPANTTPVPLKNRLFSGFSLIMCFSAAHVSGKTKDAA